MKKLVAYYSYEGNTKLIAETIAEAIDADILEIKPEKEMSSKGFMKFVWGGSKVFMGNKPKLKPLSKDPNDYDLIFIGTPIWAWAPTPPIKTFMMDHLPEKKKLAFFCSHEGNHGKTFEKMEEMAKRCELLDSKASFAPLKKDKDKTLENVKNWALSIAPTLK
jgi:flavodoxin